MQIIHTGTIKNDSDGILSGNEEDERADSPLKKLYSHMEALVKIVRKFEVKYFSHTVFSRTSGNKCSKTSLLC